MKEIPTTRRLAKLLTRYSPEVRSVARAALARMRARLRGSIEVGTPGRRPAFTF